MAANMTSKRGIFEIDHSKKTENGLKMPFENLNAVEKFLYTEVVSKIATLMHKTFGNENKNVANFATSISLIFKVASLYFLKSSKYAISSLFLALQYIFDCVDGYYARKYDQVTDFGCYFDHISDSVFCILFFIILLTKRMINTAITFFIMVALSIVDALEVEKTYYKNYSPFFALLKRMFSFVTDFPFLVSLSKFFNATITLIATCLILLVNDFMENWGLGGKLKRLAQN